MRLEPPKRRWGACSPRGRSRLLLLHAPAGQVRLGAVQRQTPAALELTRSWPHVRTTCIDGFRASPLIRKASVFRAVLRNMLLVLVNDLTVLSHLVRYRNCLSVYLLYNMFRFPSVTAGCLALNYLLCNNALCSARARGLLCSIVSARFISDRSEPLVRRSRRRSLRRPMRLCARAMFPLPI